MLKLEHELFAYNENSEELDGEDFFEGYLELSPCHRRTEGKKILFHTLEGIQVFLEEGLSSSCDAGDLHDMWDQTKCVRPATWNDDETRQVFEIVWYWKNATESKFVIANVDLEGISPEDFIKEAKNLGYALEEV